jgi:hypothetical protein
MSGILFNKIPSRFSVVVCVCVKKNVIVVGDVLRWDTEGEIEKRDGVRN